MRHLNLSPQLYDYMLQISLREDPILRALRDDHVAHPLFSISCYTPVYYILLNPCLVYPAAPLLSLFCYTPV